MHKILFLILFISVSAVAQKQMTPDEATALKAKVKTRAEAITTVMSDFTQYKHLDFLSDDIVSQGQLAFKAPNLVKWQYTKPFAYSVLFKNETLYINDDGNKSNMDVGSNKIFKQLNQLITASIRGDMFDDNEFNIKYFKINDSSLVYFLPKDEQFAKFIKAFHLSFNANGDVTEVKMIEPSDDYTQIKFTDRVVNKTLSDAVFTQ
ncbi:outer membrane lipoprotein carrier protein LolA [Zobellia galactanivorans]|uniref:Outer-membrane lipoprotein carrier protein n=1 Tax=Zobellia galactanivorans (strain DSM 12802 / CCUG 47099 / CIP 106680 / NCIMB 13871 / Dsij) TaxID=63186 RepID=G0LBI9_ZOBGA|nr:MULTISPECIES: outer membrane lipoprotein carrier protein LolA [Zobellia]MBU3026423.1 outer membrane lipoprotein carrier protein LolA [Zobellia galactanivorans]MDO6516433.1 outer membrane lipoprotein carrier protein LolA [Zobellia uliginosa]MDO6810044.1 outer membrane lipoprotein carrier protein LolA [Zobellia galactanivorans]CAZ96202.1 Outer-membrane lipoprotein carrier protein [Zobellia galactanivorans]